MEWDSLRYFLAVARQGGLTAASRDLNVSISTVRRHLNQLEVSTGVSLFVKHPTGYTLTTQGESLFARAEEAESAFLSFESAAMGQHNKASGRVRLATAENIATNFNSKLTKWHSMKNLNIDKNKIIFTRENGIVKISKANVKSDEWGDLIGIIKGHYPS